MSLVQTFLRPSKLCSRRVQCLYRTYATEGSTPSGKSSTKDGKKSESSSASATPRSSCSPDTVLTGLSYLKGQPPVVALPDDAYPEWLWDVLTPKVYKEESMKEKIARRMANRQAIKDRNFMQTQ